MALIINTNIPSLTAQRNLLNNSNSVNGSLEKLASGLRINRAADDAAGLSISESIRGQIRGLGAALNNAQDGVNLLHVAEGSMEVITENLQRIRELTVQAANDTNSSNERKAIAREVKARLQDIDRISSTSKFNTIELLTGTASQAKLQIGANSAAATNVLTVGTVLKRANTTALGIVSGSAGATVGAGGNYSSGSAARSFLGEIDSAISAINERRSQIGAFENRLQSTIQSIQIQQENLKASDSRIRDLDIASETAMLTRSQILQQSALNILSQANQSPQLALGLLRG